jgi:glutamine synthetase
MKYTNARQAAITAVLNYKPSEKPLNFLDTPAEQIFGSNVFNDTEMKKRLRSWTPAWPTWWRRP